jgi:hypothetical protein
MTMIFAPRASRRSLAALGRSRWPQSLMDRLQIPTSQALDLVCGFRKATRAEVCQKMSSVGGQALSPQLRRQSLRGPIQLAAAREAHEGVALPHCADRA